MTILSEIAAVRAHVGVCLREDYTVLQFTGKDVASWLHAQTTNDINGLLSGQGNLNALLDRKGRMQCVFSVHRFEDEYWVVIEKAQKAGLLARMDSHLFLEDVTCTDVGEETPQVVVTGPRTVPLLHAITGQEAFPEAPYSFVPMILDDHEVIAFRMSDFGEDGFVMVPAPGESRAVCELLLDKGHEFLASPMSAAAQDALRVEAGHPRYGLDYDEKVIISETPFEREAVSYTKGCYMGQEVVARLKSYGSPKQALVGLVSGQDVAPPRPGSLLRVNDKKVGEVRSSVFSPTLDQWIAMAYLDRDHRTPGTVYAFTSEEGPYEAEMTPLPFREARTRRALAESLYAQALDLFEQDAQDEDDSVVQLLEEAVVLAPDYEDAYEVLGVVLHRHHRLDEAIHYMKALARINPSCVMAHTNLSVFYVAKGMIQEAEDEKALAEQLEMKHQLDEKQAALAAKAERQRLRAEAEERIGMFQEVLEIDPEDPIATMGLGSAYMQLERYEEALDPLRVAVKVKKDYSAAFLKLGTCLEQLGRLEEAAEAYRQGIEVAGRKGDLMPLREMERRVKAMAKA
jgi:folate-binding protein YgfZ